MEVKLIDIRMKNKGFFVLTCDAELTLYNSESEPVVILLRELKYFKKDEGAWVNMPSRDWEKDGERQFKTLVRFPDSDTWEQVKHAICQKIKEEISSQDDKQPEQAVEELPF